MKALNSRYNKEKHKIKARLKEFKSIWNKSEERLFSELCFCICTPQSKAVYCDRAIKDLEKKDLLLKGQRRVIKTRLKGVRFPNNKAAYLISARSILKNGGVRGKIDVNNLSRTREWFAKNIKGLGYKEASHFLRNIGLGKDIAILDVHILKNLKRHKVIKEIPSTISKKTYLDIENKMRVFSKRIRIPLDELDLLFWSIQTGFIFK